MDTQVISTRELDWTSGLLLAFLNSWPISAKQNKSFRKPFQDNKQNKLAFHSPSKDAHLEMVPNCLSFPVKTCLSSGSFLTTLVLKSLPWAASSRHSNHAIFRIIVRASMSSLSLVIERKAGCLKEKTASGDLLNTRPSIGVFNCGCAAKPVNPLICNWTKRLILLTLF